MILRLGELLGLPPGSLDPVLDLPVLRYMLVVLGLAWAVGHLRAPRAALVLGVLVHEAALGFWALALGRPFGAFVEAGATRRLAQAAVIAASGDPTQSFLVGDPGASALGRLAGAVPGLERLVLVVPTLLPLIALPLLVLLILHLPRDRTLGPVAAGLWLLFGTGDLDALAGVGFLPGAWHHPEGVVVVLLVLALLLLGVRLGSPGSLAGVSMGALVLVLCVPPAASLVGPGTVARLLAIDPLPLLVLAGFGLRERRDPAALALAGLGAALLASAAFSPHVDPWTAHALYRAGLLLAAAPAVAVIARAVGVRLVEWLGAGGQRRVAGLRPLELGTAALLALAAPGSFVTWWDARRLDPVYEASLPPVSVKVAEAMEWIRVHTPRDAVFVAGETYAAEVAVLAGRRVLRAPGLGASADDQRRFRTERLLLSGRDTTGLAARHGLTHTLSTPGDFPAQEPGWEEALLARGRLHPLRGAPAGWSISTIEPGS